MEDSYPLKSTSLVSAVVETPIVLSQTATTRKIVRAEVVDNLAHPDAGVKVTLVHQRKGSKAEWEDEAAINLGTLKGGEGVRLALNTAETLALATGLRDLYEIHDLGLPRGRKVFVRAEADLAPLVEGLLREGKARSIIEILGRQDPDLLRRLCSEQELERRRRVLRTFEADLPKPLPESSWQRFFETNTWIFGYGLRYQFLHLLQPQAYYGGKAVTREGEERGDFLYHTAGTVRFTVLVDIKRPDSALLAATAYRSGAWAPSADLSGGVAQLQANCETWQVEGSETRRSREALEVEGIFTHQPKGILVIGHTKELEGAFDRRRSFELYRRNLMNPEVLTFDELYERARFIVENEGSDE